MCVPMLLEPVVAQTYVLEVGDLDRLHSGGCLQHAAYDSGVAGSTSLAISS